MARPPCAPRCAQPCCWLCPRLLRDATCACWVQLAIGDKASSVIRVFNPDASNEPLATLTFHRSPVTVLCFNNAANCVISGDESGVLEYWCGTTHEFPTDRVKFKHKYSTDLYCLAMAKARPTSLCCSPDGKRLAATSSDAHIRVLRFSTGKLVREYDERVAVFEAAQREGSLKIDSLDFGRRVAFEKELQVQWACARACVHSVCSVCVWVLDDLVCVRAWKN